MRPIYVAPSKDLQDAAAHLAATARNTRINPFSLQYVSLGSFTCITQHTKPMVYNGSMSCLWTQVSRPRLEPTLC